MRTALITLLSALIFAAPAHAQGRCGTHPWCDTTLSPEQRADLLLAQLTPAEKVNLLGGDELGGVLGGAHTHTGTQTGVPRLDLPTVYYSDGPVGPRQGKSTGLPVPLALAATFNADLAADHGRVAAAEAKAKGNDVIFGPAVNIARNPLSGRTFENYGEDPYLESRMVVNWIKAAQAQGVIADVKHFAANNQEGVDASGGNLSTSTPLGAGLDGNRMLSNSIVDERTLREIYLPHFEAAVKEAHVGSVMCSYNRLNGQYACENPHLLQDILRKDWGFTGYVLADYAATRSTEASLANGLDFEPWPPLAYQPLLIDTALAGGLATSGEIDQHVKAMLSTWFRFGLFDRDGYRDDDSQIDKPANAKTAQTIEEQAITLLKNDSQVLPLSAGQSIAVIGKAATKFTTGGGSGNVTPFAFVSPLEAIKARNATVSYADGSDASKAAAIAKSADVAVVFANDYYTEGADRTCLSLECPNANGNQDALIRAVAKANPKTVVVLASGGPDLTPWRNDIAGLLEAWFGGGQSGPAIASVLFGDTDPGGRLPITFPDSERQLPTAGSRAQYPGTGGTEVHYTEGVLIGYRWYDARHLTPAFPFGYGLSYTTSRLSGLKVTPTRTGATVTATVRNTGKRAGYAVPQLYLGLPAPVTEPPRQLKGFSKLRLKPGQSKRVTYTLDQRALSYWDVTANDWRVGTGCVDVQLGFSSRDIALHGTLATGGATCATTTSKVCTSRRSVRFTLPASARDVTLTVDGKRRAAHVTRRRVTIALKGLPRRAVKVRITATVKGKRYVRRSTLHPCQRATKSKTS